MEVCIPPLNSLCVDFPQTHWRPEPFEDEIHPRLRFVHRGLVGMANNGTKNSNDSQFFITLGKHCANLPTSLALVHVEVERHVALQTAQMS